MITLSELIEKAIVCTNYDQRLAVNSPTTVQRNRITTNQQSGLDMKEGHGECHDDPRDYGSNPMSGTRKWPRGSHESLAQKGEPQYFKSEQMIDRVLSGMSVTEVLNEDNFKVNDLVWLATGPTRVNLWGRAGSTLVPSGAKGTVLKLVPGGVLVRFGVGDVVVQPMALSKVKPASHSG